MDFAIAGFAVRKKSVGASAHDSHLPKRQNDRQPPGQAGRIERSSFFIMLILQEFISLSKRAPKNRALSAI
jgi:hypothetical protein